MPDPLNTLTGAALVIIEMGRAKRVRQNKEAGRLAMADMLTQRLKGDPLGISLRKEEVQQIILLLEMGDG